MISYFVVFTLFLAIQYLLQLQLAHDFVFALMQFYHKSLYFAIVFDITPKVSQKSYKNGREKHSPCCYRIQNQAVLTY